MIRAKYQKERIWEKNNEKKKCNPKYMHKTNKFIF